MNLTRVTETKSHARSTLVIALLGFLMSPVTQPRAQCQNQQGLEAKVTTIHDLLAEVGKKVPAFGGIFVDEEKDTIYVYLVPIEMGDVAQVDKAISDVFGTERPPQHRLEVLEGRYTFSQLKEWLDRMSPRVLALQGVLEVGIDDAKNRLDVGVESLAMASAVEAELASSGIPREAVNIEQVAPVRPNKTFSGQDSSLERLDKVAKECETETLKDRCRPLVGSLQIKSRQPESSEALKCTLGFIAMRQKVRGFVTVAHCLEDEGAPQDSVFYQPAIGDKNRVGVGNFNPKFFERDKNDKCPPRRVCRYSDAAFIKLDDMVGGSMGFIARPTLGSSKWNGEDTFRIVGRAQSVRGTKVMRVGSQSGSSEGEVSATCKNLNVQGSNVTYLCQTQVTWKTVVPTGDSGGPVIAIKENNDVSLVGILWSDIGVSPIQNLETTDELGLELKICAAGFEC